MPVIAVASAVVCVWLSGSEIHIHYWWGVLQNCVLMEDWCLLHSDVVLLLPNSCYFGVS